jgi:hypothetical protein
MGLFLKNFEGLILRWLLTDKKCVYEDPPMLSSAPFFEIELEKIVKTAKSEEITRKIGAPPCDLFSPKRSALHPIFL